MGERYVHQLTVRYRIATVVGAALLVWNTLGSSPAFARVHQRHHLEVAWHVPGEGRGTPAVLGDVVYFLSARHELVAIGIADGRVRWRRTTGVGGPATAGALVVAVPGTVIVADDHLIAFAEDGTERWRFAPTIGAGPGFYLGNITGDLVYAGSSSGWVHAIDLASGRARWSVQLWPAVDRTAFAPLASDDLVFVGFGAAADLAGGMTALDASTGQTRWWVSFERRARGPVLGFGGGPLSVADTVLVADSSGRTHAFDRTTGRRVSQWSPLTERDSPRPMTQDFRPMTHAGAGLVVGSLSGTLVAYDLATGRERWRQLPRAASIAFGLASDGTRIYVPYLAGPLVAIDASDGHECAETEDGLTGFSWVPTPTGTHLFAASSNAGYFAFRVPGGRCG